MLTLEFTDNFLHNCKIISKFYRSNDIILHQALHNIKILKIPGKRAKMITFLFKYHVIYLFYFYKHMKKQIKR